MTSDYPLFMKIIINCHQTRKYETIHNCKLTGRRKDGDRKKRKLSQRCEGNQQ